MSDRTTRIVETAVALAEAGGFEAVRLRDVAARANVALGTVYKRFPSKEDILVAALEHFAAAVEARFAETPVEGATPLARGALYFDWATRALCGKPNLARAILRAVASGERDRSDRVVRFHGRSSALIVAALAGPDGDGARYEGVARILQDVWFAGLVGWMGGLHSPELVVERVVEAAGLLLAGLEAGPVATLG